MFSVDSLSMTIFINFMTGTSLFVHEHLRFCMAKPIDEKLVDKSFLSVPIGHKKSYLKTMHQLLCLAYIREIY
jgi:hypothetical protein